MVSLKSVNDRFKSPFIVIDEGSGILVGIIDESNQADAGLTVFTQPTHMLRVSVPTAAKAGMVIRSPLGETYILGNNGPSEGREGAVWESYRLFPITGQYNWQTRTFSIDLVTTLKTNTGLSAPVKIWAALIPVTQEQYDKGMHVNFEQITFITNADVSVDDVIDNRNVTKVDKMMGLSVGILT